jgi:subtilisin family serine protease
MEKLESRTVLASAYAPGELLIQFDDSGVEVRGRAVSMLNGYVKETIHTSAMIHAGSGPLERIGIPAGMKVEDAISRVSTLPGVRYAEPNWIHTATAVSNDTNYTNGSLWGMYSDDAPVSVGPAGTTNQFGSQAEKVWNNGFTGSSGVYIGVIDEGIQFTHPDLVGNVWINPYDPVDGIDNDNNGRIDDTNGWDFFNNDRTVYDGTADDHGTHVAGTIGARGGNGAGVAGVNWNITMISAKFLGSTGGTTAGAIASVDYLTDLKTRHGLNIVATSNSWGGGGFSQALLDAITRGANQGILFVAAAGNSSVNIDSSPFYPASYDTTAGAGYDAVISVASITSTGGLSSFSNYGATRVDLGAPGSAIWSTVPSNSYASYSGTSMATPHVSGAIALYASANPGRTASQLKTVLLGNTTATTSLSGRTVTGGRLDISKMFGPGVALPDLSINNVSVTEGNSGTISAVFTVTLSAASGNTVTVNYATADGSATAGSDYLTSGGPLSFAPGEISKTFSVTVNGDTAFEGDETFTATLSGASNANIADASGTGTILNDDAAPPATISINDVSAVENGGSILFTVSLSAASGSSVSVSYHTVNGTARGGRGSNADYANKSGTLTFSPGDTTHTVSVTLRDDTRVEGDENFFVDLFSPVGAPILDSRGIGTIIDNDTGGNDSNGFDGSGKLPDDLASMASTLSWWSRDLERVDDKPLAESWAAFETTPEFQPIQSGRLAGLAGVVVSPEFQRGGKDDPGSAGRARALDRLFARLPATEIAWEVISDIDPGTR